MAEVFVAKAFGVEGFQRLLAIKKILPTLGEDRDFIRMFVDEARIAAQLTHPNVVQVLELGKHDGSLYIAMEYVSGRDLRQVMERYRRRHEPMPLPQACLIVAEVCAALDHAHQKRDAQGRLWESCTGTSRRRTCSSASRARSSSSTSASPRRSAGSRRPGPASSRGSSATCRPSRCRESRWTGAATSSPAASCSGR